MSEATFHTQPPELTNDLLEEAHRVNDAYTFLEDHNVRDMANESIEAHGQRMSVAEGIAGCPPFAQAVRGVVEDLKDTGIEDKATVHAFVRKTLQRQVTQAPATVTTEAEKK